MTKLSKVSQWAAVLRGLTIAAMIVLPVTIMGGLFATPLVPEAINRSLSDINVSQDITRTQLIIVVALNLISPAILLVTLNEMRKLFGAYVGGDILSEKSAHLIQRVGQGFLALAIVPFILRPIQTVLLTYANPPGERSLAVGLDSDMIFFALSGGLIVIIGWAMREASDVAAENKSFV
ncbi:hypothetical protein [Roseobacter sp. CCS2]|uniref:hypothetical protein n=1 Tax=Roseobacter sp. CCS2 TaxID=391593 RepID=UPI0000F40011|nr:hypothetical protein [Roseobacter sp. CCS2]EBA13580.1 hypothetical protein RCCS2_06824 [Roseobacter sp. CCS2]